MVQSDSSWRQGPEILFHCSACGEQDTLAETSEQCDTVAAIGKATTFVKCKSCRKTFISEIGIDEIADLSPTELAPRLSKRILLFNKMLAFLGVGLCWVPLVGLVIALIALVCNWKTAKWLKTLSLVGVALSLAIPFLMLVYVFLTVE